MPLTSAADLDKHTSLSFPYTNHVLEEMVQNLQDLVQREQAALWRLRVLHTQLCGDDRHASCDQFQNEDRMEEFDERYETRSVTMSVTNETDKFSAPMVNWHTMNHVSIADGTENSIGGEQPPSEEENFVSRIEADYAREEAEAAFNARRLFDKEKTNGANRHPNSEETSKEEQDVEPGETARQADEQSQVDPSPANGVVTSQTLVDRDYQDAVINNADKNAGENANAQEVHRRTPEPQPQRDQISSAPIEKQLKQEEDEPGVDKVAPSNGHSPPEPQNTHDLMDQPVQDSTTTPDLDSSTFRNKAKTLALNGTETQDYAADPQATEDVDKEDDSLPQRRMTTRAHTRAQAASTNGNTTPPLSMSGAPSPHCSTSGIPTVHPFFIPPASALPDSTVGLVSPNLADEARRQLSLYVQKQSEVVRQSNELLKGLRRALRLKNTVWDWCRNEAHVGEMSDGEDWVDMEKWDLDTPLRKGEEVDDDDTNAGMVAKKTRNRRAAA